ncbi:MAG: autotransporter domain-containing protein, partial [Parvularculaceae bacterium]|nr:autotransporter domain-containing protein [Parvularculaceae bacterium]
TQTTVNSGATLGGIGTVGRTTIASGGFLAPGNSIGTLTVSGNLTFAPGSAYIVEVSPTASDRTNVTGTAALAGSVNALWGAGSYVARQYTILNATGGVSGTFTGPVNTNLPSGFLASLSYDANNAYLNLAAAFTPPSVSSTVNGFNSVSALSRAFAAGTPIPVASGGLTATGANQIAGQLQVASLGQIIQAQENVASIGSCRVYDGVVPGGKAAGSAPSTSGGDDGRICADGAEGWSVWLGAFAGRQKFDGAAAIGSQDVKGTRYGLSGGAAYSFGETTLGVSVSGGWNDFDLAGVYGSADATFVQVGVSGFHEIGKAYVQGGVSYGWHNIDTDRTLTISGVDRLQSSFKAKSVGARAEAGWRFGLEQGVLAPFAAIQLAHASLPTVSERVASGSNQFALTFNAKSTSEWRSELGVKGAKAVALGGANVLLGGGAAWGHNFDVDRSSTASFTGVAGSTFTVFGAAPGANLALLSGTAQVQLPKGWSLNLGANGELSGASQVYGGRIALEWKFN